MRKPPYLGDDGIDPSTSLEKDIYAGWWLTYPSEKYEFVSWEYYSQYMER